MKRHLIIAVLVSLAVGFSLNIIISEIHFMRLFRHRHRFSLKGKMVEIFYSLRVQGFGPELLICLFWKISVGHSQGMSWRGLHAKAMSYTEVFSFKVLSRYQFHLNSITQVKNIFMGIFFLFFQYSDRIYKSGIFKLITQVNLNSYLFSNRSRYSQSILLCELNRVMQSIFPT